MLTLVNEFMKGQDYSKLMALRTGLEDKIRAQANKANGKANIARTFKAVCKSAERQDLKTAWVDKDSGYKIACDGYRFIAHKGDLAVPLHDPDYDGLKVMGMTGSYEKKHEIQEAPTQGEVKAKIDLAKATDNKPLWKFTTENGNEVYIDAKFLLEMLWAMPDATLYIPTERNNDPVYMNEPWNDETFGLILPIRIARI